MLLCDDQVDVLVNNAGLALGMSSVSDHDIQVGWQAKSGDASTKNCWIICVHQCLHGVA